MGSETEPQERTAEVLPGATKNSLRQRIAKNWLWRRIVVRPCLALLEIGRTIYRTLIPLLPPILTGVAFLVLLSKVGSNGHLDAETWTASSSDVGTMVKVGAPSMAIYRLFFFSTAFLVFLDNLFVYLKDVDNAAELANPHDKHGRGARKLCFWLAIGSTLLIFIWLLDICDPFLPSLATVFFLEKNELFAILLFALFALVDCLLWFNCRATEKRAVDDHVGTALLRIDIEYYKSQVFFTDIPVAVGLLVIASFAQYLTAHGNTDASFMYGLRSGAAGMHLAY